MEISQIDQNFALKTGIQKDDVVWYDASEAPFVLHGAYSANPYRRLPADVAAQTNNGVVELARCTAGVRACFRTDSPYLALHCEWPSQCVMHHMPAVGSCGFDLYARRGAFEPDYIGSMLPPVQAPEGFETERELTGRMTDYILNFPLYNPVSRLYLGVQRGATFETPANYEDRLPVVFYGSSITQGGCASRPGNCYQNFLSRMLNMDYVNLGFSGSCRAEDAMIEYLAGLPMSVLVVDYDHNAPTVEHLQNTHFKLYSRVREAQPDLPILFLTRPDYRFDREVADRRCVVFETFLRARKAGDERCELVDGATLFGAQEWQACTVDGCHPNDLGFYRFAQRMYPALRHLLRLADDAASKKEN